MIKRDDRYDVIKPMVESGQLVSFNQIFKYIPKTIVAKDLGKKVDRFNVLMTHVDEFTLRELFRIGHFCKIDDWTILKLIMYDHQHSKNGHDRST
jgi:hypothetical protein